VCIIESSRSGSRNWFDEDMNPKGDSNNVNKLRPLHIVKAKE